MANAHDSARMLMACACPQAMPGMMGMSLGYETNNPHLALQMQQMGIHPAHMGLTLSPSGKPPTVIQGPDQHQCLPSALNAPAHAFLLYIAVPSALVAQLKLQGPAGVRVLGAIAPTLNLSSLGGIVQALQLMVDSNLSEVPSPFCCMSWDSLHTTHET